MVFGVFGNFSSPPFQVSFPQEDEVASALCWHAFFSYPTSLSQQTLLKRHNCWEALSFKRSVCQTY